RALRGRGVQKADHGHCRILRACRQWPRHRCTAEQRDEVAPFHSRPSLMMVGSDYQMIADAASQRAEVRNVGGGSWSCENAKAGSLTGLGRSATKLDEVSEHIFPISSATQIDAAPSIMLPSIATLAFKSRPIRRHSSTNRTQTFLIAPPLSLRKSAIVLWSAANRPSSHITSRLRPASRSSRRLDCTRLR